MSEMDVTARFRADVSDMKTKMSEVQGSFKKTTAEASALQTKMAATGQTMTKVGKKMSLAVTLPIVGLGIAAVKMSMDFDASMTKITSLVGIAADEVEGMKKSVLELSGQTAKSPKELADALFVVTSAGLRGKEALDALGASAKAGAAGLGETGDIARAVAGSMNAYGAATLSASRATDIIVATARAGNFETSQFAGALGRVLPFAKQAGASLEEVGGAVALLTRTNGDAAQSITQVSALMRAFVVPTEEAKKALSDAGLSASDMRDRIAKDGLAGALQFLDESLGGNREQLGKLLGSSEAAGAAFQILDADAQTLKDTFGVVTDSVGITDEAFKITAESSAFKMQQAITEIKNSLIDFGAIISPFVVAFAGGFATMAGAVNSLPGPVKAVAIGFALLLAAAGPVLTIFGKAMTTFVAMNASLVAMKVKFVSAFTTMTTTVGVWGLDIQASMAAAQTRMSAMAAGARTAGLIVITSLRSIGVALKGMLVSFGPVGVALIAATVAFEIFSNRSQEATERLEEFKTAMSETGDAAIVAALELVIGKIRDLNVQLSRGEAVSAEQVFKDLGFTIADVATKTLGSEADFKTLTDAIDVAASGATLYRRNYQALGDQLRSERTAFLTVNGDLAEAVKVTDETRVAAKLLGLELPPLAGEFDSAAEAAGEMKTELQKVSEMFTTLDANIAAIRAKDELRTLLRGMDEAIAKNNRSLTGRGEAATKNRDAVAAALLAGQKDVEAWAAANDASTDQVEARFKKNTIALKAELVKQGFDEDEIEAFLGADSIDTASVNVRAQMTTAISVLADRLGPIGLREMKGVGRDVMDGLILGIDIGIPPMERAMSAAILAAKAAAKSTAKIKSPSKVFELIGNDLMAGIEKGIEDKSDKVADKTRKAVQSAIDVAQEAINVFGEYKASVSGSIVGLLDLGAAYETFTARQLAVTETLADLMTFQATIQGESTDDQKTKLAELQAAYQSAQSDAAAGAQSIVDEFIAQGEKLAEFNANMQTLLKAGLSRNAFDAIRAETGERGAEIAAALVEGNVAENARRVSDVYRSVQNMGDQTGQIAAATFTGNGVKLATDLLTGLIKEFLPSGKMRKNLLFAIKTLNDSIKFEPKFIDIITRRFDEGSSPAQAAVQSAGNTDSSGAINAGVASQFSSGVLSNAQRLNAAAAAGQDVTKLGFTQADWSRLAALEAANIAALASGGIVTGPTLALIGEAGPEAVIPLSRGGALGSSNTYNVTINTGVGDPRAIGEEVVNVISKFEKANGAVFARA